jgi:hypothetical protein
MTDELRNATVEIGNPGLNGGGVTTAELTSAVADRAPKTAKFITQTPDATLTAEQALSALPTGLLKVTTGTGVLSAATGTDVPVHTHTGIVTSFEYVIPGGGAVITTGLKYGLRADFACTITKAGLFADQISTMAVDVWKNTYVNYPPTDADSITASAPMVLNAETHRATATLTGWNVTVNTGDLLWFNVDSVTAATHVLVVLTVLRDI